MPVLCVVTTAIGPVQLLLCMSAAMPSKNVQKGIGCDVILACIQDLLGSV